MLGDYAKVARSLQAASDSLVARVGVAAGDDVLDVATGTGNAAVAAAELGATVTGLDLTPELFDAGRRRAADGNLAIEWIEGDAEQLPFADGSFDRVVSVFGAMFAPDHRRTAEELVRVCRAGGGTIGVCAWTPEGAFGRMIRLLMSRLPVPPAGFKPPALWGNEEYVERLFDGLGVRLAFTREHVVLEHASPEAWVTEAELTFGPIVMAKADLAPRGEWDSLRAELVDLYASLDAGGDGSFHVAAEYLTSVAFK